MIGIRCLRCHTPLAVLDEPHRCSALTRRPALLYGALVAERNALRTALVEAQAARARLAGTVLAAEAYWEAVDVPEDHAWGDAECGETCPRCLFVAALDALPDADLTAPAGRGAGEA